MTLSFVNETRERERAAFGGEFRLKAAGEFLKCELWRLSDLAAQPSLAPKARHAHSQYVHAHMLAGLIEAHVSLLCGRKVRALLEQREPLIRLHRAAEVVAGTIDSNIEGWSGAHTLAVDLGRAEMAR